ncbi:hypothetical protein SAMN05443667_11664 [Flavobacterium gillisiae]|jgi:hypothetical protein|uniref:Uncharacterized protein n=2 Tax=Flavobacterium TaxID=237 RepID=A0A1H4G455_9FLAO|nr:MULTISPECIES: hypothetical protein [Flavobacterium]SEB03840.1 hypothetical protein SAMN05443667_11664 [Flavobacterium gillisiae]SER28852.1 hypothetical protein SAMN05444355_10979 [Flavobacterium frigoris]
MKNRNVTLPLIKNIIIELAKINEIIQPGEPLSLFHQLPYICIENIDLLKEELDGRANIKIEKQL